MSGIKSFSTETSDRYALALFQLAKESSDLANVEQNIKLFQTIVDKDEEIKNFFTNPTKELSVQKKVINHISETLKFTKNVKNFLSILVEKRRIFFVNKIIKSFLKIVARERGEISASLISSKELTKEEVKKISKDLSDVIGSSINFEYKVDENLLGGLKIQIGSLMIDSSIKNKLKKYQQLMMEI